MELAVLQRLVSGRSSERARPAAGLRPSVTYLPPCCPITRFPNTYALCSRTGNSELIYAAASIPS
jgi:hypothetical protein